MEFVGTNNSPYLALLQEKAAAGDQAAFRQIFHMFFERLQRYARAITRSDDLAVEAVDEVFVKLWRNKPTISAIQNLPVYLFVATRHAALNFSNRSSASAVAMHPAAAGFTAPSPEELLIATEILHQLEEAVETLPPRCKIIFKMVREEGLKYREVAEILNISVNTVDAQMVIAINRLKERLKPHLEMSSRVISRKKLLLLLGSTVLAAVFE